MTTTPAPARTSLSERVAEEIRAQMGRKQKTGADVARALGKSQAWISYRLSGKQAIDLNDLEAIADVLGVAVAELFPPDVRRAGRNITENSDVPDRPRDNRPPGRADQRVPIAPGTRRARRIRNLNAVPQNVSVA